MIEPCLWKVLLALDHALRFIGWRLPAALPILCAPGLFVSCRFTPAPRPIVMRLFCAPRGATASPVVARSRRGGARSHGAHRHAVGARAIPAGFRREAWRLSK